MESERLLINNGQACSVESAALTNPDADIYFIFATNSDGINLKFTELIYELKQYSNIHLTYVNPFELSKGTLAEKFFKRKRMKKSAFPLEHMADVLRILVLNKFGGQYIDLDVFSLKPLSKINRKNFACVESENLICNGIINFDTDENGGKSITNKYLELLDSEYDPLEWGSIGPKLVTKSVKNFCPNETLVTDKETKCGNFTVLPTSKCYSVSFDEWKKIFKEEHKSYVLEKIEKSDSYFFHLWSAMKRYSRFNTNQIDADSAYLHLAKKHCPRVYEIMSRS